MRVLECDTYTKAILTTELPDVDDLQNRPKCRII
jgi:hypothetical protein